MTPSQHPDATAEPPVVEIDRLRFRFGPAPAFELCLPKFAVPARTHTAIVGASGCGKTTLLRLIVGSLLPTAGTLRTLGHDLANMPDPDRRAMRRAEIGMVFQSFALLDYLLAIENIMLTASLGGVTTSNRQQLRARAETLADRLGIAHTLARKPARMSQGERQRAAICRALLTSPRLIVCDEPTGNLDPARSRDAIDLILAEADAIGATVLLVTHDHGLLDRFGRVHHLDRSASEQEPAAAVGGHA